MFALLAVFAQLRFQKEDIYQAEFTNVSGSGERQLRPHRRRRSRQGQTHLAQARRHGLVAFTADESVMLTEGSRAAIRYDNLIGGRYLALEEGAGGVHQTAPRAPRYRSTAPSRRWIWTPLIGGFRPLFRALDPDRSTP